MLQCSWLLPVPHLFLGVMKPCTFQQCSVHKFSSIFGPLRIYLGSLEGTMGWSTHWTMLPKTMWHHKIFVIGTNDIPSVDHLQTPPPGDESFYPYPNWNLFALGDWYWNNSLQKSQDSFRKLINIVRDPDFRPGNVHSTNWTKINSLLSQNADDKD